MISICVSDPLLYFWNSLLLFLRSGINTIQVLIVPMLVLYILLIIHGVYTEGKRFALAFFGGFILYGVIREIIVKYTASPYAFGNLAPIFQIINLPIAIGWNFACYLSYWFAKWVVKLTIDSHETIKSQLQISIVASMFVWFITFSIEYTGSRMGWWNYNPAIPSGHLQIWGVYAFLFGGWAMTVFCFLIPFQLNFYSDEIGISKKNRLLSLLLIPASYFGIMVGNYLILYDAMLTYIILIVIWAPIIPYFAVKWYLDRKK
ncbi:MAG: hypothetical protein ACTSRG_07515 [Candidatus Helarchaeota archaeon]